jgi:hypothetical protein
MSNTTYIYSTASSVAAFVNGYHIEQAYGFNFKESVPKIPIYGYNDYEFSKVVRGKGMVQGILVVNFVFPGYLTAALTHRNDVYNPKLYNYNLPQWARDYLPSTNKQIQDRIFKDLETELPANDNAQSKAARATYIANLISSSKSDVDITKKALNKFFSIEQPSVDGTLSVRSTPNKINSPLIADSSPVVGNQIDIYYQDPDLCSWFVRFNNVHFTEVSQSISQAGADGSSEPLYEIYEFIAKNKEIIEIK